MHTKHFIIKLLKTKDKEKNLKSPREKHYHTARGEKNNLNDLNFSSENMDARRKWDNIFQMLKGLKIQNLILSENILQDGRGNQDILR